MNENATQALTVVPQGGVLVSVQNFKAKLEQQKQMRSALVSYVKSEMKPRHHFYTLPQAKEGTKPSLSQDGARLLCGIYEVRPAWDILPTYHDDNHISVMVMCRLINIHSEVELASGGGFCTSRERAFARSNIPDEYNNVIKRAQKRAYVDAVLRLPMVSEVFDTGDGEGSQTLQHVRDWYKGVPARNKKAAVAFIFHCTAEDIGGLEETELDAGLAEIERFKAAQIDWGSKTLVDDMRKARAASAKKTVADLYGDAADARKAKQEVDPELVVELETEEISHTSYWEIHEVAATLLHRLEPSDAREGLAKATYELEALLNEELVDGEHIEEEHYAAAAERVKKAMQDVQP